jgi:hypothetical protein
MLTNGHELMFFLPASNKSLAGKGHRLAAWQKDNELLSPRQRDETFLPAISRLENYFLHSCQFASIRGHNSFFLVLDSQPNEKQSISG